MVSFSCCRVPRFCRPLIQAPSPHSTCIVAGFQDSAAPSSKRPRLTLHVLLQGSKILPPPHPSALASLYMYCCRVPRFCRPLIQAPSLHSTCIVAGFQDSAAPSSKRPRLTLHVLLQGSKILPPPHPSALASLYMYCCRVPRFCRPLIQAPSPHSTCITMNTSHSHRQHTWASPQSI